MSVSSEIAEPVWARASDRCEYCQMHQSLQGATFHIEHIVPRSKGGITESENLALACPSCNLHKADSITVLDADSGETIDLFNPRTHAWSEHFEYDQFQIVGKTKTGEATVTRLEFNSPRKIKIREAELGFDLFPPDSLT